ncbi:hypothetical protein GGS23DRAFT_596818 [Durotheca rogersii]|uniref:uncharacterized protein n=1 Tax=Durotheca rogersii TaxID=419775 RepID=UPI00221E605D|nr:uncharacterized protein GGS23DRAFT_596818 [Durotheca rogersii]KAI5863050.1 hypothetical protein GGS23DRAFT_596818 [Durotheca rogersii]
MSRDSSRFLPLSLLYSASPPPSFKPSCTHLTMTRLYEPNTDREYLIEDAIEKGLPVVFDSIGDSFADDLIVRPRSAESRSEKYSFLREITSEQLATYTPSQISTILSQRDNLHKVLEAERQPAAPYGPLGNSALLPPGFGFTEYTKPWVVGEAEECKFKCCQVCRRSASLRSYLSLDSIVKGDVPPTAAVGFGFHYEGTRPVIHPDRLKNIGLRAVPWPGAFTPPISSRNSSNGSEEKPQIESTEPLESGDNLPCQSILTAARSTPLPVSTPEEEVSLSNLITQMMREEMEEGRFHGDPLEVDHGVAVLEESVNLAVPDLITQA